MIKTPSSARINDAVTGHHRVKLLERFFKHVHISKCWAWTGTSTDKGYGNFVIAGHSCLAHRVSYRLFVGEFEDGMVLDHLCRNRLCVRPSHLEQVTPKVNAHRSDSPPALNFRKKKCWRGHLLPQVNSVGQRQCKQCATLRMRKHRKLHAT